MLTTLWTVFYFELLLIWRRSQEWLYPIMFFVIVISLFPFAFSPDPILLQTLIPGGVWLAALFASILSINTLFHADVEEGSLEQWMLSPVPLPFLTLSKLTAHWLSATLPLILLIPFIGWLFQLPTTAIVILAASLLLGTPILILLGSIGFAPARCDDEFISAAIISTSHHFWRQHGFAITSRIFCSRAVGFTRRITRHQYHWYSLCDSSRIACRA